MQFSSILRGVCIPGQLDKSSTAVCTSPCSGGKPQEWSWEECWTSFTGHLFFMLCGDPPQQHSYDFAF